MQKPNVTFPGAPRPVTPLGLIARNLELLRERGACLDYRDPVFTLLLDDTARLAEGLDPYIMKLSSPASPGLRELARETASHDWPGMFRSGGTSLRLEQEMLCGDVEGQLLKLLVRVTRASRILEIGMFTGYSALAMAEGLAEDGILIACEVDDHAAAFARNAFDRSPHGGKIQIARGPALATLERLRDAGETFDLVFIDADKQNYLGYFDLIVTAKLIRPDGLICVDNTLMQGEAYLDGPRSAIGEAIAAFNEFVAADHRVEQVLLPVRDGLTLIRLV